MNITFRSFCMVGFTALLCATLEFAPQAQGAYLITNDSLSEVYQFKFSMAAKRDLLEYPGNETVAHMAAWDSPSGLQMARNMPFLELENTSLTAEIISFTMTIGDPGFFFDYVQNIEMPAGINFIATLLSPDMMDDGSGASLIHFEFDNFVPGAVLRFQTQLHPYASTLFNYPDYRQVLFDLNGSNNTDNSILTVTFDDPANPRVVVVQEQLEDYHISTPTVLGVGHRAYSVMDHVDVFGTLAGVPEPSSLLLCGLGFACLVGSSSRRLLRRLPS